MTAADALWFTMSQHSTLIFALGATIAERPDPEVGVNKIKKCLRNRVRYTLTLLIPSLPLAARESRPFWTEKTAFVEGDDLFVVGVASKASTAEAGRQQAFEHGKIELMNYAQVTSLEAQGLVIETQMTHEESNPDGTITVYRLLRVPAAKLVAIQGRLETQSRAQEQALEQARSELLSIQQSLAEKAQKLDRQQRQVEQLLQQLTSKLELNRPGSQGPGTTASLVETLKQVETQLDAQEDELVRISQRARERISREVESNRKKCRLLLLGMTRAEVQAIMGTPDSIAERVWVGDRYLEQRSFGKRERIDVLFNNQGGVTKLEGCR